MRNKSVNQDNDKGKKMTFMTFSEHLQNWILPYVAFEFNSFDHLK